MSEELRCPWCLSDPLYVKYHDEEWGKPVTDDRKMFEFLVLEGAQAGLSWFTILKKRENYRCLFAQFDPEKVAAFTRKDIERILTDPGIIRNRLKVEASVSNARLFLDLCEEYGSFCDFLYRFLPNGEPILNSWKTISEIPATTELSDRISKEMKKRGFKFFGSTICYSHLQATGLINDHLLNCPFR